MTMPIKYSDKTDTKQMKKKTLKSLTTSLYRHRTGQNNIEKKNQQIYNILLIHEKENEGALLSF